MKECIREDTEVLLMSYVKLRKRLNHSNQLSVW